MTQLDKIKDFMKGKNKCTISEISNGTGILKNSVMGCLNGNISKSMNFERIEKGVYKLKNDSSK